jgi:hypothetical protein
MVKTTIQVLIRIELLATRLSFIYYEQRIKLAIEFTVHLHDNNLSVGGLKNKED